MSNSNNKCVLNILDYSVLAGCRAWSSVWVSRVCGKLCWLWWNGCRGHTDSGRRLVVLCCRYWDVCYRPVQIRSKFSVPIWNLCMKQQQQQWLAQPAWWMCTLLAGLWRMILYYDSWAHERHENMLCYSGRFDLE